MKTIHMLPRMICAAILCASTWVAAADAAYPVKPIKIIVPWTAGGGADAAARAVASGLTTRLGQAVVVENRPGASGAIGAMAAVSAAPDGYTLFLANVDTNAINPQVMPHLKYRPENFDPVVEIGLMPLALVTRKGLEFKKSADMVNAARAAPGKITYGTWGVGSVAHLAFALLEKQAGIELFHVPYQGGAPTYAAVLAGQVDMALTQMSWALATAREGRVQIVGMTSPKRSALAPDVPTLAEIGFSGYEAENWVALVAPKGTPAHIVNTLNEQVNAWLKTDEARTLLAAGGVEATGGSSAQLGALQRREIARWGKLIEDRGIKVSDLK